MDFLAGFGAGLALALCLYFWSRSYDPNPHRAPRADLPPATRRAVRRDRRRQRAVLSGGVS